MAKLGSSTVVTKKEVDLADSVRFNGQEPVSRSGKATGRGAFEVQSAQAISAAYYFDLAARDYTLADGAIELVIEGIPCSALIEPSQSSELIFCDWSARLRGRKHAADGGKFCRDLQGRSSCAMNARVGFTRRVAHPRGCPTINWRKSVKQRYPTFNNKTISRPILCAGIDP